MIKCINILGGSGFIGTRLSSRLKKHMKKFKIIDKVDSFDHPQSCLIADIRSIKKLIHCVDENAVIVNLAAEHRDDVYPSSLYYDVNVKGARNICEVARQKKIKKIIFTSSVQYMGLPSLVLRKMP